jgi:HK97 gp10 family phage protein
LSAVIEITVTGLEELAANLEGYFLTQLQQHISDAISTVGGEMLQTALNLVPVRTGYLRSTLGLEQTANWTFNLYARAPYAGYVEWGTRHMAARLYITMAVQQHEAEMSQKVARARAPQATSSSSFPFDFLYFETSVLIRTASFL